eukprot:m.131507 g.131507  ORF g.131507 m.131507 type:complete len:131 (+) comp11314_c0_seq2:2662-3054(+)
MVYTNVTAVIRFADAFTAQGGTPCMCATDLPAAYRNIPLAASELHLVGFSFPDEQDHDQFYYHRMLPFGGSMCPRIFDSFSCACQWVIEQRIAAAGVDARAAHLLDDFVVVGFDSSHTSAAEEIMVQFFC